MTQAGTTKASARARVALGRHGVPCQVAGFPRTLSNTGDACPRRAPKVVWEQISAGLKGGIVPQQSKAEAAPALLVVLCRHPARLASRLPSSRDIS